MSHKPVVVSPVGTPTLERSVGELVAERPGRSRVFQNFGIDFCCQGGRTLREACERKGIPSAEVVRQLEQELQQNATPLDNPAGLPIPELADYIARVHHGFLRRELPRLRAMSARVAQVHGSHTPTLIELWEVYSTLERELAAHIDEEECATFPALAALSRGQAPAETLAPALAALVDEHEAAGSALARMRELTNGFQPPIDACNTYRALFAGLKDLEEDMHRHVHLENSVLFPAAQALLAKAA